MGFVQETLASWWHFFETSMYLAFPTDRLFHDPEIEELYQRHHMQQWLPRFDWSCIALLQMLLWDVVANPPYRVMMVLHYYVAFSLVVFLHKATLLAFRGEPWMWRWTRCALLCGFLLGRGAVCHPSIGEQHADARGASAQRSDEAQSTSGIIGLGMTGLSSILALRVHTLDTLLLCAAHGAACMIWGLLSASVTLGSNTWHTLLASHAMIALVCVWQQHEQERYERIAFEQELLMERGKLLRACDHIERRGSHSDFVLGMQLLYRARLVEQVTL